MVWLVSLWGTSQPLLSTHAKDQVKDGSIIPLVPAAQVEALQRENEILRDQLAGMFAKAETPFPSSTVPDSGDSPSSTALKEAVSSAILVQQQLAEWTDYIRTNPGVDLSITAKSYFEREPVDNLWAPEYQLKLDNFFRHSPSLTELVPQQIDCRSLRCRVSIVAVSPEQSNQFSQIIMDSVLANDAGISKKLMLEHDNTAGLLNVYLVRADSVNFLQ